MSPAEQQAIVDSYDLLYSLGATANHLGFFHAACAVRLAAQQPERLLLVTKWLYPEVAKQYQTTWPAVERNIRTLIRHIWEENPAALSRLAGYPLTERPRTAEFISYLASRFRTWQHCRGETAAQALTASNSTCILP